MKLRYRVHRVSSHPFPTKATLPSGEEVDATVHSVELELVPIEHLGGTLLHRFVGKDAIDAAKAYHQGDTVDMEVTPVKPEPAIAPPPTKA